MTHICIIYAKQLVWHVSTDVVVSAAGSGVHKRCKATLVVTQNKSMKLEMSVNMSPLKMIRKVFDDYFSIGAPNLCV